MHQWRKVCPSVIFSLVFAVNSLSVLHSHPAMIKRVRVHNCNPLISKDSRRGEKKKNRRLLKKKNERKCTNTCLIAKETTVDKKKKNVQCATVTCGCAISERMEKLCQQSCASKSRFPLDSEGTRKVKFCVGCSLSLRSFFAFLGRVIVAFVHISVACRSVHCLHCACAFWTGGRRRVCSESIKITKAFTGRKQQT